MHAFTVHNGRKNGNIFVISIVTTDGRENMASAYLPYCSS